MQMDLGDIGDIFCFCLAQDDLTSLASILKINIMYDDLKVGHFLHGVELNNIKQL